MTDDRFAQQMGALLHKETKGTDDWRDDVVELFERQQRELDRLIERVAQLQSSVNRVISGADLY